MIRAVRNSGVVILTLLVAATRPVVAQDWPQFRGPGGLAVSADKSTAVTWSDKQNIRWKTKLEGTGSSSPIVWKDRVYITHAAGAMVDRSLKRYLRCIDKKTGRKVWEAPVLCSMDEDPWEGFVESHGYASHTPVTDGERIYAFFGKSGVVAFDMNGKKQWQTPVGLESHPYRRGSSASPILYEHTVIVVASDESESIRGLDKKTGKELWKSQAKGFASIYSTPLIVAAADGREDLIVPTRNEIWGLNPRNGKLRWHVTNVTEPTGRDCACSSPVSVGDTVYLLGPPNGEAKAIRVGRKNKDRVLWTSSAMRSFVPSPVLHKGHLYWIDDKGIAFCGDAKTGNLVHKVRLKGGSGASFYSSVVVAGDKLYGVSRRRGVFVLQATPKLKQLAHNTISSDDSSFHGSPAISDGDIFLRSDTLLYCISAHR